jgi:hypothetical protein
VYTPGGTLTVYVPSAAVVAVRVVGPDTVIVAPASGLPRESVIFPVMVACPDAGGCCAITVGLVAALTGPASPRTENAQTAAARRRARTECSFLERENASAHKGRC